MNLIITKIYKLGFKRLFLIFLLSILGFGTLYYVLSPYGQGIRYSYDDSVVGFWDCVYFSTVTITTLGFGDFYPVGVCRPLVALEAITGLMFVGVMVSKLTAAKSEYILHRLYFSDVEKRLLRFNKRILNLKSELVKISQCVIGNPECREFMTRVMSDKSSNIYDDLLSSSMGLSKYIGYEVYYGEFFLDISRNSIHRVLRSIITQLETLTHLFTSISEDLIRKNSNKRRLAKTMKAYYQIAKIVDKYSDDPKSKEHCTEIQRLSQAFLDEILHVETLLK